MSAITSNKSAEVLLVSCNSSDPFSTLFVDPRTGVSAWSYKGSELQGAISGTAKLLGNSGEFVILSVKDRPLIHCLAVHNQDRFHEKAVVPGPIECFCTTKDGRLLFAAIANQVFAWELLSGRLLCVHDIHYQPISSLSFSNDESLLFTSSKDGLIHVYATSELLSCDDIVVTPIRKWNTHSLAVKSLYVTNSGEPRIATCGLDHVAAIHSISLNSCIFKASADRPLTACILDPAESRFFIASDLGNIVQINLYEWVSSVNVMIQTNDVSSDKYPVFNGHNDEISCLAINADGFMLASGDINGQYCIWDIASQQCIKVCSMRGEISSLAFVPNYPSISFADIHSSWKPAFGLQRTKVAYTSVLLNEDKKRCEDAKNSWTLVSNELMASCLSRMRKLDSSKRDQSLFTVEGNDSDYSLLQKDIEQESNFVAGMPSRSISNLHSTGYDNSDEVHHLRDEVKKLERINNQIVTFVLTELVKPKSSYFPE